MLDPEAVLLAGPRDGISNLSFTDEETEACKGT